MPRAIVTTGSDAPGRAMTVDHLNLAAVFDLHARTWADKPAIVSPHGTLTHAGLALRIRQSADHLVALGAGRGSRIGLALGDTADHLVCLLALARIGAVVVPMDVRWAAAEKARLARALDVAFVLAEAADAGVELGGPVHLVDTSWQAAVAAREGLAPLAEATTLPFVFALSSGTTAAPSGPLLCHHHFFHRFVNQWVSLGFTARDRFLAATPLYFGATRGFCLSTLNAGGTVCLAPPHEGAAIPEAVERHGATTAFLVPTQLRRLLELDDAALAPLRALRVLVSSGSALHADEGATVCARLCPNLFDYYGTTEGGGISILAPDEVARGAGSVGRPVFMVEVEIVDGDDRPVPAGEVGRIRYRGPGMAAGDALAAGDHATATHPDGWFYPGDLGLLDRSGFLHLRGRAKDVVVRGGVNVYPLEVEQALLALAGVADAAVVGWPSRELGEEIAAFVVADAPAVAEEGLLAACRGALAPYKVPRRIFLVDDLPRNSSGKVLKERLRARLEPL